MPRLAAALLSLCLAGPAFAGNHIHRLHNRAPPPGPAVKPPHLVYYGGKVISNVKVVAVFWGPNVDPQVMRDIGAFYADLVAGPMFGWLSEYDTTVKTIDGRPGTGQHIGQGRFVKAVTIAPKARGNPLADRQIQGELQAQIR